MAIRMISLVTLNPGADVGGAVHRARMLITNEPHHISGEVGQGVGIMGGRLNEASYAVIGTFASREALESYSASPAHRAFAEFVRPQLDGIVTIQYETTLPLLSP